MTPRADPPATGSSHPNTDHVPRDITDVIGEQYPALRQVAQIVHPPSRDIVGREAEREQVLAAMMRPELCNCLLIAEAGTGKLLPLDTRLPTPTGWTTMGEVTPGDHVLGRDGRPTTVTFKSATDPTPHLYELVFDTGQTQIACADHQWLVADRGTGSRRPIERVRTTADLITCGLTTDHGQRRFALRIPDALHLSAVRLPADPYTLGQQMVGVHPDGPPDHRHTPAVPYRGSYEQRLGFLQGVMDAHGTVDDTGCCHIVVDTEPQARQIADITRSLGIKTWIYTEPDPHQHTDQTDTADGLDETRLATIAETLRPLGLTTPARTEPGSHQHTDGADEIDEADTTTRHHVKFITTIPVFRAPRRRDRLPTRVRDTHQWLHITAIRPVESRPGACIQVDNADHLYLCGDYIPTHNTALVQSTMMVDTGRLWIELDPSRMITHAGGVQQMASLLKDVFDQAEAFVRDTSTELVVFIDEFHQIVQLSDAAVEAIKPVLAASGVRGLRVVAATTYEEFHTHISSNQPLVERLQRINLSPPDRATTVTILRNMAERYGVSDHFVDDHLFGRIHEYTNRFMPASSQPRKSILVLDSMVGWHRLHGRPLDTALLGDVLKDSLGVNVAMRVDGASIKAELDKRVFSQDLATTAVAQRLQLSVADLNDKTKPEASFLFTGSTGTGKTELTKQLATLLFGDDSRHLIRFDMTEYSTDDTMAAFRSELTRKVWERAHAVVLFDEIEKASGLVTRLLLQVLDDGRLSDDHHREVSFLNCYIVMTTNAGSEVYTTIGHYAADDTGSGEELKRYEKLIRTSIATTTGSNRFPPELLGRIDQIVPFQPLSLETQRTIVKAKLAKLVHEVNDKHGVRVRIDKKVLQYLIDDQGSDDAAAGGARAAVAKMTKEVTTAIATFINQHPHESTIRVDVVGDLVSDHKNQLLSHARIEVTAAR